MRAHRARQAGRDEPPELAQALVDGDELARAVVRVRALQADLAKAAAMERRLRQELRSLRQEITVRDQRYGWLDKANETERAARRRAEREREAAVREAADLRARLRVAIFETRRAPLPSAPPAPSRAERRRRERDRKRRE